MTTRQNIPRWSRPYAYIRLTNGPARVKDEAPPEGWEPRGRSWGLAIERRRKMRMHRTDAFGFVYQTHPGTWKYVVDTGSRLSRAFRPDRVKKVFVKRQIVTDAEARQLVNEKNREKRSAA